MKTVVLDGFTLNPGDLSWDDLGRLGQVTVHDRTPFDALLQRSSDADAVLSNKVAFSGDTIAQLPQLKYIGVTATGYDIIDTSAADRAGIVVTNVPAYGTDSVAQMVFAHLLDWTQHVADHARAVREGRWAASPDWCFWDHTLVELRGRTMGIVGYGRIGQAVAHIALAFGMRVLATTQQAPPNSGEVRFVGIDTLFRESDVVSLHCPLTKATRGLVSRQRLSMMKRTALLINTSRGPLVDEQALADALETGAIAGASLDVLGEEPPGKANRLVQAEKCHITPHIAWATKAARTRLLQSAVENITAFSRGQPRNVVAGPGAV
ncbi:MAG: D-2-hydroxyacid dehydrogenase [Pirellulales bacterium]